MCNPIWSVGDAECGGGVKKNNYQGRRPVFMCNPIWSVGDAECGDSYAQYH